MHRTALQRASLAASWPAQALPCKAIAAPTLLFSGACLLRGWSLENNSASSTDVSIIDGVDSSGKEVAFFHMTSAANNAIWMGNPSLIMELGVFIGSVSFALRGSVFFTPLDDRQLDALREHGEQHQGQAQHGKGN